MGLLGPACACTSLLSAAHLTAQPALPPHSTPPGKKILVDADVSVAPFNSGECKPVKGHIDCAFKGLTIDTTTLSDGTHKLFLRTDSFVDPNHSVMLNSRTGAGTFSSVTLIAFKVCNAVGGCAADATAPPDEQGPAPQIAPMNPPPGAAWYNGSQQLPAQAQVSDRPYDCSGWFGPRTYLEAQTWHTRTGQAVGAGSTQLTVGACLPHKQMIAGIFPVDILLTKYNFPSFANVSVSMKVAFFWNGGNVSFELSQVGDWRPLLDWQLMGRCGCCG
jgi:hypothetical protein